jgi:hypothetical protein
MPEDNVTRRRRALLVDVIQAASEVSRLATKLGRADRWVLDHPGLDGEAGLGAGQAAGGVEDGGDEQGGGGGDEQSGQESGDAHGDLLGGGAGCCGRCHQPGRTRSRCDEPVASP